MSNEQNIYTENATLVEIREGSIGTISIKSNNHNDLDNRNIADQHEIKAIHGLQEKLSEIQNPTIAKSVKGNGYAEYHMWKNPKYRGSIGRFVTLVDGSDQIEVINESNKNIFGVTVPKDDVAFIGRDKWEPIIDKDTKVVTGYNNVLEDTHDLVCLVGNVKVRYTTNAQTQDIYPGDYVKPNIEALPDVDEGSNVSGYAIKADSNADGCYRVIRVDNVDDGYYVEINLSLSATDVKKISVDHAKSADNYTNDGTIKTKFDDITTRIDQEVSYIEAGTTIVGKAKNYDETEGTIKAKFEDIDSQIEDIVDGTTVVAHSTATDYVNVGSVGNTTVQPYDIKTCVEADLANITAQTSNTVYLVTDDTTIEDMVAWKTNITTGDEVVFMSTCASGDGAGNNIQDNYYYLGARSDRKVELIQKFSLDAYADPGVYEISPYHYIELHLPDYMPKPSSDYMKLIVEITGQTVDSTAFRQTLQGGDATSVRTGIKRSDGTITFDTDWKRVVTNDMMDNILNDATADCVRLCDSVPKNLDLPIGTIMTCHIGTDGRPKYMNGSLTGLYGNFTGANQEYYPEYLSTTGKGSNPTKVPGTWGIRGLCGQDNDGNWYILVQRVG